MLDTNTLLSRPVVLPRAKTGTFPSIECMLLRKSFPNLHSRQKVVPTPLSQINLELTPSGCLPVRADFLACCQKFPTTVQDRVRWDLFWTWQKSGESFFLLGMAVPGKGSFDSQATTIWYDMKWRAYITYDMHWYAKICYAIICYYFLYSFLRDDRCERWIRYDMS